MTEDIRWRIGVVQMDCVLGDRRANLDRVAAFCRAAFARDVDLVVFPECATTGYFVGERIAELAEPSNGPSARELAKVAGDCALDLVVGDIVADGGRYYDVQLLFGQGGQRLAEYRKAHLFAAERDLFTPGDQPLVTEGALGRIGMSVCYDLIFPEYIRTLVDGGADLVVNSTNWISDSYQRDVWDFRGPTTRSLARTRALENTTFVAMANRVGREEGFDSLGFSCIAGPSGQLLASIEQGEGIAVADIAISGNDLDRWRGIATYLQDRRTELYR